MRHGPVVARSQNLPMMYSEFLLAAVPFKPRDQTVVQQQARVQPVAPPSRPHLLCTSSATDSNTVNQSFIAELMFYMLFLHF